MEQVCSLLAWRKRYWCTVWSACGAFISVLALAVVALWFGHIPGFRWLRGQQYFHGFRRAPLHVLGILLAQHFLASLVYCVLLGFSLPPFPPGSVSFLLSFGVRVWVWVRVRVSATVCVIYLLSFPLSF